jgi:hypothetical protein
MEYGSLIIAGALSAILPRPKLNDLRNNGQHLELKITSALILLTLRLSCPQLRAAPLR